MVKSTQGLSITNGLRSNGIANVKQYPASKSIQIAQQADIITIGDLHGNPLVLIYHLIQQGCCNLNKEDYAKLVLIVNKKQLDKENFNLFNDILHKITFNKVRLIRLIGDETADRGPNDFFILKLLEKLAKEKIATEILISNHGHEFVRAYENKFPNKDFILRSEHSRSLHNLYYAIKKEVISEKEVTDLVDRYYKPNLKALSYSLNKEKNKITIFSHAAIDLDIISCLVEYINQKIKENERELGWNNIIQYNDKTAEELANTIDNINRVFSYFVEKNCVNKLFNEDICRIGYYGYVDRNYPFEFMIWNRKYDKLNRPDQYKNYQLCFAYGHDSYDPEKQPHIYPLDSLFGKGELSGACHVHHSNDRYAAKQYIQGEEKVYSQTESLQHNHDVNSLIEQIIGGIRSYQNLQCKHLGFFSFQLDSNRGMRRAKCYYNALTNDHLNLQEKLLFAYALLASNDGKTLKRQVAQSIGGKNCSNQKAREHVQSFFKQAGITFELHDAIVGRLVAYANSKPKDTSNFPSDLFKSKKSGCFPKF